jgi:hypothetical protein
MAQLALLATVPVLLGVAAAGYLGAIRGARALWTALAFTLVLAVLVWGWWGSGLSPFVQRFVAPIAVYLPPLTLAGVALSLLERPRWTVKTVSLVAIGAAASNIFLAQFFFVLGCAGGLWVCP